MLAVPLILLLNQVSFNLGAIVASPSMAIQRADVRKELKLTKDQSKKLDEIQKNVNRATTDAQKSMDFSSITKAMEDGNAKVWEILDDPQDQRLRELLLQMKGPGALVEEETAKNLEITDEQVTKLKDLKAKCVTDYMSAAQGGIGGQKKIKGILEQFEKDALAVLTPDQAKKYAAMLGKPVKNIRMGMPPF